MGGFKEKWSGDSQLWLAPIGLTTYAFPGLVAAQDTGSNELEIEQAP